MKKLVTYFIVFSAIIYTSCSNEKHSETAEELPEEVFVPIFNSDSAYKYVKKQVEFGPRVPNSKNHVETGNYLVSKLKSFNWQVTEQQFESTTFDNQQLYLRNIIASHNLKAKRRVLLAAHWDTRPFADKDNDRREEPILGANDGASGVGVLLEIARSINAYDSLNVGVDIIFFDGEDWGEKPDQYTRPTGGLESWWCLGSQYWSKNKHKANYSAYYGILLDMVGGENAKFYQEGHSTTFAPSIVNKVWSKGQEIGYSRFFINQPGAEITDDHYFVHKHAKIPMIDIIPTDPFDGSFGAFHHTHADNMDIISKQTLKAVGETVLHVLYNE